MITTTVISTSTSLSTRKAAKRSEQEELRISSLDIAELCGKPHNDILKAIRKMEPAWVKNNGGKFSLVAENYDYNAYKRVKRYFLPMDCMELCIFIKICAKMCGSWVNFCIFAPWNET